MRPQVELHMEAVRKLLDICGQKHIYLNDGIKRAIFWLVITNSMQYVGLILVGRQDLNSSIITGSRRLFNHTTFTELQWGRDVYSPNYFILSPGFQRLSHLLSVEFIEVLKDIHALRCIRDSPNFACEDATSIMHIDNHQASIESRILDLPKLSLFLECCYLAAYLSACMICCKVWRTSTIPVGKLHPHNLLVFHHIFSTTQNHHKNILTLISSPMYHHNYIASWNKLTRKVYGMINPNC
jgi:hypothetical protein